MSVLPQEVKRTPVWNPVVDINAKKRVISHAQDYFIYEDGRVFSNRSNKFLAIHITTRGYAHVKLGADNWKSIHRLVAEAFIDNHDNKPLVNHIDGNTINNHVSNLEWVTHSENMIHAYKTGLNKGPTWSEERKKAHGDRLRGCTLPVHVREKISKSSAGKKRGPFSDIHRARLSEATRKYHARKKNG